MAITPAQLRADFPEFASTGTYPDTTVNFWLGIAGKLLRDTVWLDVLDEGTELFVCHQLTVAARNTRAAAAGGIPGQTTGVLTSKAVDKVSAGYDVSKTLHEQGGFWNLSTYGIQFYQLVLLVGAQGATQI